MVWQRFPSLPPSLTLSLSPNCLFLSGSQKYLKGIYLTSSSRYGNKYSKGKLQGNFLLKPAMLICAVIPGNPYPVREKIEGTSVKDGYQSHFTIGLKAFSFSFFFLSFTFTFTFTVTFDF